MLYPALCDPADCSPSGSSVHGILQTRVLEWVAITFSWGSPRRRDGTQVSCIGRWLLYHWAVRGAQRPLGLGKSGLLAALSAVQTGLNVLSSHSESLKLIHKREMVVCRKVPLLCWTQCSKLKQLAFCFRFFSIQPFRMKDFFLLMKFAFHPQGKSQCPWLPWKVTSGCFCKPNTKDITKTEVVVNWVQIWKSRW